MLEEKLENFNIDLDADEENNSFPNQYICPISREVMKDPVMTVHGQTYDRSSIEEWFETCRSNDLPITDPTTHAPLGSDLLITNFSVKQMIEDHPMLQKEHENNQRLFNKFDRRKRFTAAVIDLIDTIDAMKNDSGINNKIRFIIQQKVHFSWLQTALIYLNTEQNENLFIDEQEANGSLTAILKHEHPEIPSIVITRIEECVEENPVLMNCSNDILYVKKIANAVWNEDRRMIEEEAGIIQQPEIKQQENENIEVADEIEEDAQPNGFLSRLTGITPCLKR